MLGTHKNASRTDSCRRRVSPAIGLCVVIATAAALLSGCAEQPRGALSDPDFVPDEYAVVTTPTVPLAGVVTPPETGAFAGVFRPPAPLDMARFDAYVDMTDRDPAILMWFQPWAPDETAPYRFDAAAVVATMRRGAIPMISWEPWDPGTDPGLLDRPDDQSDFRLQRIVDGEFDAYIREWAEGCAMVGGPIMLRPMHEMNGNWYPWNGFVNGNSPKLYIAAWRHVHDIFVEEGATNVTWVWSVNHTSGPDVAKNYPEVYYPGDAYVDWIGISGFNWGNSRPGLSWSSFTATYDASIEYLRRYGKPMAICEFASVETPGDKAEWITDAYQRIRTEYPEIKAVIYYDNLEQGVKGKQDWNVDSSPESLAAYTEAIGDPYFVGAVAPTLEEWPLSWARDTGPTC